MIQETPEGVERVRVKVRVNIHGLITITAVGLQPITAQQEKAEKGEEKMETEMPVENGGEVAEGEAKEVFKRKNCPDSAMTLVASETLQLI